MTTDIRGEYVANYNRYTWTKQIQKNILVENRTIYKQCYFSNAAPYICITKLNIMKFLLKVIHITYLVRGLHRIAEKVCAEFFKVVKIVSKIKFQKLPSRIQIFKNKAPT